MASGIIPQVSNNSGAGYCKMPDGTLIQWGTVTASFKNGVITDGNTEGQVINFPVAFVSPPVTTASITSSSSTYATATAIAVSASNAVIYMIMYGATTYTGGGNIMWTAIGRWK